MTRDLVPRRAIVLALAAALAAFLGGCSGISPGPTPTTYPGPSATSGSTLDQGDLRLVVIDDLGPRWYCDPDVYPVAHGDEQTNAIARFAEMRAEGVVFGAMLRRLGLSGATTFSDAQKLAIYRLWKPAVSIPMDPAAGGGYTFDYVAAPVGGASQGVESIGTIDSAGRIVVTRQLPADAPTCPICLARGTLIETPSGAVPVERVRLGDAVWTLDGAGGLVPGTVIALGSTEAPPDHHVIRLVLADGRSVTASPGHPLADGRRLADLRIGDLVGGSPVVSLTWLPYDGGVTFDLVVSGPTGTYLSDGIALGSTLHAGPADGGAAPAEGGASPLDRGAAPSSRA